MYLFALIYPHFIFINSIICFCKLHFFCFSSSYPPSLPLIIPKSGTRFKVIAKHLRNFVHASAAKIQYNRTFLTLMPMPYATCRQVLVYDIHKK